MHDSRGDKSRCHFARLIVEVVGLGVLVQEVAARLLWPSWKLRGRLVHME